MRCTNPDCKSENPAGAQFCHRCGRPLEVITIDRWPEYNLKPTSICRLKGKTKYKRLIIFYLFAIAILSTFIIAIYITCDGELFYGKEDGLNAFILFLEVFFIIMSIFHGCKAKNQDLKHVADYFQQTDNKYVIIIKDGKFGVYNRKKRKVQIPCEYSYLSWKSEIGILSATATNGETYNIDINNNRLK